MSNFVLAALMGFYFVLMISDIVSGKDMRSLYWCGALLLTYAIYRGM